MYHFRKKVYWLCLGPQNVSVFLVFSKYIRNLLHNQSSSSGTGNTKILSIYFKQWFSNCLKGIIVICEKRTIGELLSYFITLKPTYWKKNMYRYYIWSKADLCNKMAIKIPLCTVRSKEISDVSFYKDISLIRLRPYPYDSTFIISLEVLSLNPITLRVRTLR